MTTLLVWVLIVTSFPASRNMVEQLGPYVDLDSCLRVQASAPIKPFETSCVQVKIYRQ